MKKQQINWADQVGKYIIAFYGTDVRTIGKITGYNPVLKTIGVTPMIATLVKVPTIEPGGFLGHSDNDQVWSLREDPSKSFLMPVRDFTSNMRVADKPTHFEDYNF